MLCKKAANSKVLVGQTEKDLYPYVLRLNEGELSNRFEADRKLRNGEEGSRRSLMRSQALHRPICNI